MSQSDDGFGDARVDGCGHVANNVPDPRKLVRELNAFRDPRRSRSAWELAVTVVPFLALFAGILFAVQAGYLLALALTPLAGLFLLRLFIIQHDCGHGSFFPNRSGNDWLGRALGVFTLTPYDCWRRSHALHHAGTGNLDARGFGDVDTLTVREFSERSFLQRLFYRLYRQPLVLLGIGPAYLFIVRHRLPIGQMKDGWLYWTSAMGTNAATAILLLILGLVFGALVTTLVFLPVLLVAASLGVWLFYVQHQFEEAHWETAADWSFHDAALGGSSYLQLPAPLRWFTGNIGIHHVHHLASRIPFYRLPEVLKAHPGLKTVNRITPRQAMRSLGLALWDEDRRRLVSFREAARRAA
ncbi:fatty acid desaturase [Qipengyuania zhejiangensis]|uniref:fatty acid desaturase n=1 Tax=Qipengyuania zhejiangensis TaxID=3077782 RepID=UPI002D768B82|nr:fatty acid desaturase [Qipengyuania sp. Z2]